MEKWASKWLEMYSQIHRFKKSLTLLKIEVIEYDKNGLQNGLKCILRDTDFLKKSNFTYN